MPYSLRPHLLHGKEPWGYDLQWWLQPVSSNRVRIWTRTTRPICPPHRPQDRMRLPSVKNKRGSLHESQRHAHMLKATETATPDSAGHHWHVRTTIAHRLPPLTSQPKITDSERTRRRKRRVKARSREEIAKGSPTRTWWIGRGRTGTPWAVRAQAFGALDCRSPRPPWPPLPPTPPPPCSAAPPPPLRRSSPPWRWGT